MQTFNSYMSLSAVLSLVLAAPGLARTGLAQTAAHAEPRIAPSTSFAALRGVQTPILLRTSPDAVCRLHPAGSVDADHVVNIFANGDGEIRIQIRADQQADQPAHMLLDCAATDGTLSTSSLEVHATTSTSDTSDKLPAVQLSVPKDATVLPALTQADALALTPQQLRHRGYPPRPDLATSPETYATWLRIVSRPLTLVPARTVDRPDISHPARHVAVTAGGNASSANWSGFELRGNGRTYQAVQGEWQVPGVLLEANVHTYSALWVGLDGDGTIDLVQAGTEQENLNFSGFTFGIYYAWTELVPNQPTEHEITGFTPSPGDQMYTEVWIGDAEGNLNVNGANGWFLLVDENLNQGVEYGYPLGSTHFTGSEAEWIMERPGIDHTLPDLAQYGIAIMSEPYALQTNGSWINYTASNDLDLTMKNDYVVYPDNDILSLAFNNGSGSILFVWTDFH